LLQLRGLTNSRRNPDPRLDVHTPKRIYPDLFGPNTSCRSLAPFAAWKPAMKSDRAELGLPKGELTRPAQRAEAGWTL
jgi:hypothetical protein